MESEAAAAEGGTDRSATSGPVREDSGAAGESYCRIYVEYRGTLNPKPSEPKPL